MAEIWTMGEMIVEIMREKENEPLDTILENVCWTD